MSCEETVKWQSYDWDRDVYSKFSATHIYDGGWITRCGMPLPGDRTFEHYFARPETQPVTCKRCLAKT